MATNSIQIPHMITKVSAYAPDGATVTFSQDLDYSDMEADFLDWEGTPSLTLQYMEELPPRQREMRTQFIRYDELNDAPWSNTCAAYKTPYTDEVPYIGVTEAIVGVYGFYEPDGTFNCSSYKVEGERKGYLAGWPPNVQIEHPEGDPYLANPKNLYLDALSGTEKPAKGVASELTSLMLQLLELKDAPQLFSSAMDFFKFLKDLPKNAFKGGKTLRDLCGFYLAKIYGVDPTIEQVDYFYSLLNSFKDAIQVLKQSNTQRLVDKLRVAAELEGDYYHSSRHPRIGGAAHAALANFRELRISTSSRTYSRLLDCTTLTWDNPLSPVEQYLADLREECVTRCAVVAQEDLIYSLFSYYDLLRDASDAYISFWQNFWQITRLWENIWNISKLSFVVDWFIDVGGALGRLDKVVSLFSGTARPLQGVWRSKQWVPYLGHTVPSAVSERYEIVPYWNDSGTRIMQLEFRHHFTELGAYRYSRMYKVPGQWYRRQEIAYSGLELLLPEINIDLNLDKLISIFAIGAGFTK